MDLVRDLLRLHSLVDLQRLFGGVHNHPAVRAFGDVCFELSANFLIDAVVEKVAEFV
jgi:hypothetical protein